jgi:hypothetical protein
MPAPTTPSEASSTLALTSRRRFIFRVELMHVVLGVLGFGAAFFMATEPVWIGAGAGAAVAIANFHAMASLLERLTMGDMQSRSIAVGLLMVKLLVLGAAVLAILTLLSPDAAAFAAGLSVTPLSLLLVSAFARPTTVPEVQG